MDTVDLCGTWSLRQQGEASRITDAIQATVPGCVHTDLLEAGKIEDPYYRDRERELMWIGETDWQYGRSVMLPESVVAHERVLLRCDGLDTFAEVRMNERKIGKADNQFRTWEFDVTPVVRRGENSVEIDFLSTFPYIKREQRKRSLFLTGVGQHRIDGSNRVRKSQCNYGWDWGPMCVTHGIWRPIRIIAFDTARITDVRVDQQHGKDVRLAVAVGVERVHDAPLTAVVEVLLRGDVVTGGAAEVSGSAAGVEVVITKPELWWPNGLGEQPLYEIRVELWDRRDHRLDQAIRRVGLRTLELDQSPDFWGTSFRFVANGKPFFAKGANWIPADTFVTRITDEHYGKLVGGAAHANMNMLRVWGGGIYEQDVFYDLCDEQGICVWQDFMFACSAYPVFDEQWLSNVRAEACDTVRRIRHHPCIALWCGNNEIEQMEETLLSHEPGPGTMTWDEYAELFDKTLPEVLRELDPDRSYWPSSPHSPLGDRKDFNNPACGDAHLWSVWHGREPFEWYRGCEHRFNSEFGFQSFPEPAVVRSFTAPEDRNITSYVMEHHQRSGIGNDAIIQYMLSWFQLPTSFEMVLWLSQILQGMAITYAVEHWRRQMPRGMGTLYWQINDCWPVASWSSIDYQGNWKALHYMARRFYAPVLISGVEDPDTGKVEIHVSNDLLTRYRGRITWTLTSCRGEILDQGGFDATVASASSRKLKTLDFSRPLADRGKRDLLLWLQAESSTGHRSDNLVSFERPKHLCLEDPLIETATEAADSGGYRVAVTARRTALWVWLDLEGTAATYSQRFFHLRGGESAEIVVCPRKKLSPGVFDRKLQCRSLWDTY